MNFFRHIKCLFKRSVFVLLLLYFSFSGKAQNKTEIGITLNPGLSTFYYAHGNHFGNRLTAGFGATAGFNFKKFRLSTGIQHLTQGATSVIELTSEGQPEGSMGTYKLVYRIRSLVIPVMFDYNLISGKKIALFFGLGLYGGVIYQQTMFGPATPDDPNVIHANPSNGVYRINTFEPILLLGNAGLGIKYKLNEKLNLFIRPNQLLQIRRSLPGNLKPYTLRLSTVAMDCGLYYTFN